jgi:trans-aconitate methyltransferase
MQNMNIWEQRYQNGQTGWDRGDVSPALLRWLNDGLLKPGRIVVPGCGRGHEVVLLARRGFDVIALDVAPSPVAELKQRLVDEGLSATVLQEDVLQWQPEKPVDAVYEQTCLCALEPALWLPYERQLHRWLQPGGKLFALFMQTGREGGPPHHCDMKEMTALFPQQRWRWQTEAANEVPHPSGIHELAHVLEKLNG